MSKPYEKETSKVYCPKCKHRMMVVFSPKSDKYHLCPFCNIKEEINEDKD